MGSMIHKNAEVLTDKVGNGTQIWQYAIVLSGATIGENCNINCHTFIENDVTIGNNVTVKAGVYLWDGIEIHNNVFIGPNVTFTNDKYPKSKVYPGEFQKTIIEDYASIGAGAILLGGIKIGKHALVGAGALVTKDVQPNTLVVGSPAKIVAYLDDEGNKLMWDEETNSYMNNKGQKFYYKKNTMKIPFLNFKPMHQPIKDEMMQTFESFYDSNWYILGESVKKFEKQYASFNQVENCIGVSNGLDALHLALMSLGIGEGDEVIVPSNTYIATALAVSFVGAKPVFVEPRIDTYNINPELIEAAINLKTKAIMPVHLYGQACEMEAIIQIAKKHNLFVIEDNAQSQGATFNNTLTGAWGDINGTSFYPGKNLGALGDAGGITTNNAELAHKVMTLRNYGSEKKYYNEVIGHNMRLDECQAALLSVKLKYLENWTAQRKEIAAWYNKALSNISEIVLPKTANGATHVYHLYVIRTNKRDELQEYLNKHEIGTLIHYPIPPHLQKAYSHLGLKKGDFPLAEEIANTCISLPLWPGMTESEVIFIAKNIADFFK